MYPFMASFYNKITNNVSQGLERGAYVSFDISCFSHIKYSISHVTCAFIALSLWTLFYGKQKIARDVHWTDIMTNHCGQFNY
jgi:hypothetical protein